MRGLYWLRSDLRMHDNPALLRFQQLATQGHILWCPSASQRRAGKFRRSFLWASLASFQAAVEDRGAAIQIEDRDIRDVLPELLQKQSFDRIFYSKEACSDEQADEAWIRSLGISCEALETRSLYNEADLPFPIGDLPEVFTHFRKAIEGRLQVPAPYPAPTALPEPLMKRGPSGLDGQAIAKRITHLHPHIPGGEAAGIDRMNAYIWQKDCLRGYKETRDGMLNWDHSSKLSPWLAVGALSPRLIHAEIKRYESERIQNASTYWLYFELLWREYFHWIAHKWGSRLFTGMKAQAQTPASSEAFAAWSQARTGQAFIDANMKELNLTGWMSNRGRQNVANYFVKTMGGDWRSGAAYFEKQLIDYDPASNWGNWAYQAGTGQDPRDRRFDPEHQASLYDPEGLYVRLWNKAQEPTSPRA
ncbi:MAG TPA: DASH family cryptochrome [Oligoflexus sp.]|uniref:DASH family cryptochrome n=1 Tax=Oligoflexus sp. TaxID=1971216 RepID=UPI002D7EED3C|nr:DASH family cryptochrome [Oligoflexus sp.]HET9240807.1 DASH family cryptochrome [Oligoflexus sp.]